MPKHHLISSALCYIASTKQWSQARALCSYRLIEVKIPHSTVTQTQHQQAQTERSEPTFLHSIILLFFHVSLSSFLSFFGFGLLLLFSLVLSVVFYCHFSSLSLSLFFQLYLFSTFVFWRINRGLCRSREKKNPASGIIFLFSFSFFLCYL